QSHFAKGRDVGCLRQARLAAHRIGLNASAPHQRQLNWGIEKEINLAGQQIWNRGGAATIGHERELRSGLLLEEHGPKTEADRLNPRRRLVGIGLQPGDQSVHVLCRQSLTRKKNVRLRDQWRDRREISHHIVWKRIESTV